MTSVHCESVEYRGYHINVYPNIDNWVYVIYSVDKGKRKRKRAMQFYISDTAAMTAAKNYIDKFLNPTL